MESKFFALLEVSYFALFNKPCIQTATFLNSKSPPETPCLFEEETEPPLKRVPTAPKIWLAVSVAVFCNEGVASGATAVKASMYAFLLAVSTTFCDNVFKILATSFPFSLNLESSVSISPHASAVPALFSEPPAPLTISPGVATPRM